LDNLQASFIPGTASAQFPFWSPDGRFIGFFADGKLKKVDLAGAPPQTLSDAALGRGGTWNRDDVIVFAPSPNGPLVRVSAAGGVPVPVTQLDASRQETAHRHPFFLPDGNHFLYVAVSTKLENSGIYVGSLDSKDRKFLLINGIKAQFASGHLLFMRENTLMAQRFDPERLELQGDPFRVAEQVGFNPGNSGAGFSASDNGVLALRTNAQGVSANGFIRWFDRTGKGLASEEMQGYVNPVISPDLSHLAVAKPEGTVADIWILDLMRKTSTRFTFDPNNDNAPLWSPDGQRIVFQSNRSGTFDLYQKNSSGVDQEQLLLKSDHAKTPVDWSADGRFLLYRDDDPKTRGDLWVLPLTGDKKPIPVVQSPFNDYQGRFSADGKFVAYVSNDSGMDQVYVQGFPNAVSRWQISTNGGNHPRWRRDGKELFFLAGTAGNANVMAVDVTTSNDGALKVGVPHKLFQAAPTGLGADRNTWDTTPDGQRFLVNSVSTQEETAVTPLTIILNWRSGNSRSN
jgi:Tol biopolymer transport system component